MHVPTLPTDVAPPVPCRAANNRCGQLRGRELVIVAGWPRPSRDGDPFERRLQCRRPLGDLRFPRQIHVAARHLMNLDRSGDEVDPGKRRTVTGGVGRNDRDRPGVPTRCVGLKGLPVHVQDVRAAERRRQDTTIEKTGLPAHPLKCLADPGPRYAEPIGQRTLRPAEQGLPGLSPRERPPGLRRAVAGR